MAEVFDPYRFLWWRFNKYEFSDGYISPSPNAELEMYDPWQAYRDSWDYDPDSATSWTEKRQQGPPYLSLLALAEELKFAPDNFNLDKKNAGPLLKWCSEFGLLGILPQRVQMITLTPRWLPERAWEASVGYKLNRPKDGILYPVQFVYYRDNSAFFNMGGTNIQGWHPMLMQGVDDGQKGKRIGQICSEKLGMKIGVLIQDMRFYGDSDSPNVIVTPQLYQESFKDTWSRFFPTILKKEIETYLYPPPLSAPFWKIYSENVSDFLMGAFILRDALTSLNESLDQSDKEAMYQRHEGFRLLNGLVSSSSIVLSSAPDGSFRQEWRAASLLGCFAMMALQDLTQKRKVVSCEKCNRLFVTEAYQARYCSDKCRQTVQKRRYRQRLKEEKDNG